MPRNQCCFDCSIPSAANVYDGDTIKDVRIEISIPPLDVGLWIRRDIRLDGIDTPESRPRRAGRTAESILREKQAAKEARQALIDILSQNDFQFQARDLKLGKYAGRIIAKVFVGELDAGEELIKTGHALPYNGRGPRPTFTF